MRVLNPGPGEVVDRLTIVARKIVEGKEKAEHFHKEMEELFHWWENRSFGEVNEGFAKAAYLLAAVNAALWQLEDKVREFREGRPPGTADFSQLAFRIQQLNDRRAELVKEINAQYGVVREEKL